MWLLRQGKKMWVRNAMGMWDDHTARADKVLDTSEVIDAVAVANNRADVAALKDSESPSLLATIASGVYVMLRVKNKNGETVVGLVNGNDLEYV